MRLLAGGNILLSNVLGLLFLFLGMSLGRMRF